MRVGEGYESNMILRFRPVCQQDIDSGVICIEVIIEVLINTYSERNWRRKGIKQRRN